MTRKLPTLAAMLVALALTAAAALAGPLDKPKQDGLIGERADGYIGFVVDSVSADIKKLVDRTITRLMRSGEFSRLYTRWFESPIPPKGMNLGMPMSDHLKANLKARSDKPAL